MAPRPSKSLPSDPEDDSRLSAMRSELELSTFLNKGVLQTNSELKLRIVELERENRSLRQAESALAQVEENLENAEKRILELETALEEREREIEEREGEVEEEIKDALAAKEGLERENKLLRGEIRGWREIGGGVVRRMGLAGLVQFTGQEADDGVVERDQDASAAPTKAGQGRATSGMLKASAIPPKTSVSAASNAGRPASSNPRIKQDSSRPPADMSGAIASGSAKSGRVVRRDVPQQRATPRDVPPPNAVKARGLNRTERVSDAVEEGVDADDDENEDGGQEEGHRSHAGPSRPRKTSGSERFERTYRTRTTGPAPAVLRGDLRDGLDREAVDDPSSSKRSTPVRPARTPMAGSASIRQYEKEQMKPRPILPAAGSRSTPATSAGASDPSAIARKRPRRIQSGSDEGSDAGENEHEHVQASARRRVNDTSAKRLDGGIGETQRNNRDKDDHWGQPIIVKKERFSLSPDRDEDDVDSNLDRGPAQVDTGRRQVDESAGHEARLRARYRAYSSDDDPLAGGI